MIKQLLLIFVGLFCTFLFSCAGKAEMEDEGAVFNDDVTENTKSEAEVMPLEVNPSIDQLDGAQRNAFEAKAIQKLQDFFDYIKIISDPNLNNDLKNHSYNLALELFVNDTISVADSLLQDGQPVLIKDYLSNIMIDNGKLKPNLKEVNISAPLSVDSTGFGQGQIRAIFFFGKQKFDKTFNIHLLEVEKEFGETNQKTIEVKLGNIY